MQKGLSVGFEKLGNALPGKKIECVVEDNASDAGISLDKAKKLVETDKVALIIGPVNGGGTTAVAQYVQRVHVPKLDAMGTTLDGASFDWSFGPVGLQLQYGFGGGVYAGDVIHYKTATMLGADFVRTVIITWKASKWRLKQEGEKSFRRPITRRRPQTWSPSSLL